VAPASAQMHRMSYEEEDTCMSYREGETCDGGASLGTNAQDVI